MKTTADTTNGEEFHVLTRYDYSEQENTYRRVGTLTETRMVPVMVLRRVRWEVDNGRRGRCLFDFKYDVQVLGYLDGMQPVRTGAAS